ncbi:MAG: hypothetical protein GY820_10275 [Gammaproteobacteria bacterium]|nr:hypothetical protein [Gammaproteobacteria bacterium]
MSNGVANSVVNIRPSEDLHCQRRRVKARQILNLEKIPTDYSLPSLSTKCRKWKFAPHLNSATSRVGNTGARDTVGARWPKANRPPPIFTTEQPALWSVRANLSPFSSIIIVGGTPFEW